MSDISMIANRLKKKYGTLRVAGSVPDPKEHVSTGNLSLDLALGGKGIAIGYATEVSGGSGSGKTTLMQLMLADMQKNYDAIGIWIDREKAWTNDRAEQLGIDLDKVIVVDPVDIPTVTDASLLLDEILSGIDEKKKKEIVKYNKDLADGKEIEPPKPLYKFIAIDSISSFASGGKIDKADMGKKAQEIHNLFRGVLKYVDDNTFLMFTNQRTFKIGVMFGNNETTTGGEGPKYYTTYRLKLDDRKQIRDEKRGNEPLGNWINATVIKTRFGPNFRQVNFPFYYKESIPFLGGYARMLVDRNYLKPNNKEEFKAFKQATLKYGDNTVNEHKMDNFFEKFPELLFTDWPDWKEK